MTVARKLGEAEHKVLTLQTGKKNAWYYNQYLKELHSAVTHGFVRNTSENMNNRGQNPLKKFIKHIYIFNLNVGKQRHLHISRAGCFTASTLRFSRYSALIL